MTTGVTPTYLQFHLAFLLPAVMLLMATAFVSRSHLDGRTGRPLAAGRRYWLGVAVVTLIALAYTTPWDNYLIATGVWSYGEGTTLATIGYAPIGEYLFIVVQPWLTALWLSHLAGPVDWPVSTRPVGSRLVAIGGAALLAAAGWLMLGTPATFYFGAILAWAAPVLALQWAVGAPQLWASRRLVLLGTFVPTVYLCVADRIAIELGIWILSDRYTTGITVAGLPVEEATFFLVTNLFVVQGLVLFQWVLDRRTPGTTRRSETEPTLASESPDPDST